MVCPFLYGGNRDAPNFAKLCAMRSKCTLQKNRVQLLFGKIIRTAVVLCYLYSVL